MRYFQTETLPGVRARTAGLHPAFDVALELCFQLLRAVEHTRHHAQHAQRRGEEAAACENGAETAGRRRSAPTACYPCPCVGGRFFMICSPSSISNPDSSRCLSTFLASCWRVPGSGRPVLRGDPCLDAFARLAGCLMARKHEDATWRCWIGSPRERRKRGLMAGCKAWPRAASFSAHP